MAENETQSTDPAARRPARQRRNGDPADAGTRAGELAAGRAREQGDDAAAARAEAELGRRQAVAIADEAATAASGYQGPGARGHAVWHRGKSFVALHPLNRDRQPVYPGDPVHFEPDEGEHVRDLLDRGHIVEGRPGDTHVQRALTAADRHRGRAVAAHLTGP